MTDDPTDVERMLDRLKQIKGEAPSSDAARSTDRSSARSRASGGSGGRETNEGSDGRAFEGAGPADWRSYFPFDAPYPNQETGIEQVVETGRDNGYAVVEGACGSGKTLLSLLAGISLVRDPETKFERVFVITSVKQQLQQFEADLRAINRERAEGTDPVRGVTLVGKTEMCPYTYAEGSGITPENVNARCADLREATRTSGSDVATIVERAERGSDKLAMEGVRAPYPGELVTGNSCPFYAKYLGVKNDEEATFPLDFADGEGHVADPETVRRVSTEAGFCPHSLMAELQHEADVVVGNYYHVFSHSARHLTDAVVGEDTFLVVDEAHMLEERVRGLFETTVSTRRLETAITEIEQVLDETLGDGPAADVNRVELQEHGGSIEGLKETKAFLRWIHSRVDKRVSTTLERNHGDWRASWGGLPESVEIELRDPKRPGPDELTMWSGEAGFDERDWKRVRPLGTAVEAYLTPEDDTGEFTVALPGVGAALEEWYDCDHTNYFREIELTRRTNPAVDVRNWDDVYNGKLALCNCLPTLDIAARLEEFGGGVLMSATLAPLSVFREVVGLDALDREVSELQYPLRFPAANRDSVVVDTTQFTRKNKATDAVREEYAAVVEAVARSPGNVLITMPSYAEATWAANVLRDVDDFDKPVLVDESATNAATQRLKKRFFLPPAKVLVTSARGTLTEGVDYAGDRLSAALVCSVPFVKLGPRARAIVAAYEAQFGDDVGFEYALTVPAVRKARQALGRVIRGPDEVGVRVLADERYATTGRWNSAKQYLSESEQAEFERVAPTDLADRLDLFWRESR